MFAAACQRRTRERGGCFRHLQKANGAFMASTVGDFIVQRLYDWGVRRIYGYPGDGINGIMGALGRATDKIRFIQARHEELAAFMACGHAKFSREVGVCLATSGPGAIHLLNGLYDAKLDHQPVVAIVGQSSRAAIGGRYQQEVDLQTLFKDVAGAYVATAMTPAQVRHLIDSAMRIALSERTVTCVIVPHDLQHESAVAEPPREHDTIHSGIGFTPALTMPLDQDLRRAADVLNAGERVAMLIGIGAADAADEIIQVAELLGAGVAKALLGKAVLPDDLSFVTGAIGLLGTEASWMLMNECDTLLMVGTSFPYSEFLPKEGTARGVQIDIDGRQLSLRYPMEVSLVGDSAATLRALAPLLRRKENRGWRTQIEDAVSESWKTIESRALADADPINPQRVFSELSPRLPDDVIVTADSGTAAIWYARNLRFRPGMMGSLSGGLATMGCAVPYAIAAKFCHPGRPVIAAVGDGAMQMNGINGLITIAKYWREWSDPRLVVVVLNNHDLNMVTWEQRVLSGDPKFVDSQELPDCPYAGFAESLGLLGIRVERPEDIGAAWERVLDADRPAVLDVVVDPDVPPLPPHTTWDQARAFATSLLKGDPEARGVLRETLGQTFRRS
jgi:pyruvate dehydrogenase (quinone)